MTVVFILRIISSAKTIYKFKISSNEFYVILSYIKCWNFITKLFHFNENTGIFFFSDFTIK